MTIFEQLQEVMATTLNVAPQKITDSTTDEDLPSWDSLGHVNLMLALEQTFGVYLDVEDFPTLNSVQAIMAYLKDHADN
ncbi:acyl carrier protein [Comamonadaceae bacterium G21597-S1]|nr:acyl carrier protein [Comamonadaceae bacterium G21597-S1]